MNIEKNSVVFIQTYMFESGLWYLAKSLAKKLMLDGCTVYFLPKEKYVHDGGKFIKQYPDAEDKSEFEGFNVLSLKVNGELESTKNHIIKYNPKYFISFETFMQTSNHFNILKGRFGKHLKFIDVPMIEWVDEALFNKKQYNIFDEIWCLTDQCFAIFNKTYPKISRRESWNYVDDELFFNTGLTKDIVFYHQSSLNKKYSSKNSDKVIIAFDKYLSKGYPGSLIISGEILDQQLLNIVEKHANITVLNSISSKKDIAKLMQKAKFLIAPSGREGLGLSLYEAEKCGCKIITSDIEPLNKHITKYLCKPSSFKKDSGFIPVATIEPEEIYKQLVNAYNDLESL